MIKKLIVVAVIFIVTLAIALRGCPRIRRMTGMTHKLATVRVVDSKMSTGAQSIRVTTGPLPSRVCFYL